MSAKPPVARSVLLDELAIARDNAKRVKKSITRRQRGEASLADRYQTLLANNLNHPASSEENLSLHSLLLFLQGLAEMINNWKCACTLDEILAGEMVDIIRNDLIPKMAAPALANLNHLHQQAIDAGLVEKPVTSYDEILCLSSCIGKDCPWKKDNPPQSKVTLKPESAENEAMLTSIFEQLEETINVVIELTEQFERDAQEKLHDH